MSASACSPIRANSSLYGSPATEKIGSFCDSTSELKTSIMGMPVAIILSGMRRRTGLTTGEPMSRGSPWAGPRPSRGRAEPSNTRPSNASEKGTCMGRCKNRTRSLLETPWEPAKTCRLTSRPSSPITCARDSPRDVLITASSS